MDSRSAGYTTASWAKNEMAKKGEDGMVLGPRTRQDVGKKKAPSLLLPAHPEDRPLPAWLLLEEPLSGGGGKSVKTPGSAQLCF